MSRYFPGTVAPPPPGLEQKYAQQAAIRRRLAVERELENEEAARRKTILNVAGVLISLALIGWYFWPLLAG